MVRLRLLAACALTACTVGCTHCDTCDDFPAPCTGPNCGYGGGVVYNGGMNMGQPMPAPPPGTDGTVVTPPADEAAPATQPPSDTAPTAPGPFTPATPSGAMPTPTDAEPPAATSPPAAPGNPATP